MRVNPELRNSEGRTYANSTPAVSRFACDPLGGNPQPTGETASPLPNPLRPTLAVGARPKTSHQRLDRCPTLWAGLTMASPFWEPRIVGPVGANTSRVCWSQTAKNNPHPAAHHKAGQAVGCSLQARSSEVQWTPSNGQSFPLRPRRCQRAPRSGARAFGKKTADLTASVGALAGVSLGAYQRRFRLRRGGR